MRTRRTVTLFHCGRLLSAAEPAWTARTDFVPTIWALQMRGDSLDDYVAVRVSPANEVASAMEARTNFLALAAARSPVVESLVQALEAFTYEPAQLSDAVRRRRCCCCCCCCRRRGVARTALVRC
jgi:hypothetical protein